MKHTQAKLFLQQSYESAWQEYEYVLDNDHAVRWDWIVITASNEKQAKAYREQIEDRRENNFLPEGIQYVVIPDPDGKRVGSGGATLNVLKYIAEHTEQGDAFIGKRILVIHSGGDSKRVPQYSACGKLFAPVPRELPNGTRSTLFDEFMITLAGVAPRMNEGMLVISGDIVLLFNPLQIDLKHKGAAALSIKEPVEIGVNHGVFQSQDNKRVNKFLHKQPEDTLREEGAVNESNCVDLDTGTIWLDGEILHRLYSLIAPSGKVEKELFDQYINDRIRLSFYGDFLYPLAVSAEYEGYMKEEAEGEYCDELLECRKGLWNVLHDTSLALVRMSPAKYIHFGTTQELLELTNGARETYGYLGWKRNVLGNSSRQDSACNNSYISETAKVGRGCYLEDAFVGDHTVVGAGSVLSGVETSGCDIPEHTVLHGVRYEDGSYVTRIYGVSDNPKSDVEGSFLCTTLGHFIENVGTADEELWDSEDKSLWMAKLYPVCKTMKESVEWALVIYKICQGTASEEEISRWKEQDRTSLMESFNRADTACIIERCKSLEDQIRVSRFLEKVGKQENVYRAMEVLSGDKKGLLSQAGLLLKECDKVSDELKERIYLALSYLVKKNNMKEFGFTAGELEDLCYQTINRQVREKTLENFPAGHVERIVKDEVYVEFPVRVNLCGGPSDAPPYCLERGGAVINMAISLRGELPVRVTVRKLEEKVVRLESMDLGHVKDFHDMKVLRSCGNYDNFSLHKACLMSTGGIPIEGDMTLAEWLEKLGGGIYISTSVDVPMGSGLGTSSILAAACIKGINELLGQKNTDNKIFAQTLCAEQLMDTGGGWQDQVGGATNGIKLIVSEPGIPQELDVRKLELPEETMKELGERFVLIYSGQRRLAKNILRQEMNRYIMYDEDVIEMNHRIQQLAVTTKYELERGDIDEVAKLLNEQWEVLKKLDHGSSNMCIEQIFEICDDLIVGKSICGAGGGGFLQAILKKGVRKEELSERLEQVFQDCGVAVWDCELV